MKKGFKKRFVLIFVLILIFSTMGFALAACTEPTPEEGDLNTLEERDTDELYIMTYNIRMTMPFATGNDAWNNRKLPLQKHIRAYAPDIVGMQEIFPTQRDFLNEWLPEYACVGRSRDSNAESGEGLYTYYRKDRIELITTEHYWLSTTPEESSKGWDAGSRRIVIKTTFKDKRTGDEFIYFNVHFDNSGVQARKNGLEMVLNDIADETLPCILAGDFNFNENDSNYAVATAALSDARFEATESNGTGTFNNYKDETPTLPIDFVMTTKDLFEVSYYKVLEEKVDGVFASDHYPVLVKAKLK